MHRALHCLSLHQSGELAWMSMSWKWLPSTRRPICPMLLHLVQGRLDRPVAMIITSVSAMARQLPQRPLDAQGSNRGLPMCPDVERLGWPEVSVPSSPVLLHLKPGLAGWRSALPR